MIVYAATLKEFIEDVETNRIEDRVLSRFQRCTHRSVSQGEYRAWRNSLQYMHTLLARGPVPHSAGVAIEYGIPMTSKRIDFLLSGRDASDRPALVIIELKQWERVDLTDMDGIVRTVMQNSLVTTNHPSFQAWCYAALLEDFNETVRTDRIQLIPCAWLHNCSDHLTVNDPRYREYTGRAPSFLRTQTEQLRSFIARYVRDGDQGELIYRVDGGKIKPSKSLADALSGMMQGNREFLLIDDQKLVYETALALADRAARGPKQVLLVNGGPGTGKSVVAINLLVELLKREKITHYVTRNSAPREIYCCKLAGTLRPTRIKNLFKGSGSYIASRPGEIDVLLIDEAHRLNQKSGIFQNQGTNQILEIIRAAQCSVFFLDEQQQVTWQDIGDAASIRQWAESLGAQFTELSLQSQFRCNGSDGYLAWLDHTLQLRETANPHLGSVEYDFRVVSDPNLLRELIEDLNRSSNSARIVAGYCWDWVSKRCGSKHDIVLQEHSFAMQWNLATDGMLWLLKPESVAQAGCIHTCQGLELDYVGVIIGPDLIVRDGRVLPRPERRAKTDKSLNGFKTACRVDPKDAQRKAECIIKNTYRTLLSRGRKGCIVFCTDPETAEYLRASASPVVVDATSSIRGRPPHHAAAAQMIRRYEGLPLPLLQASKVQPFVNAIPVVDIAIAAGQFSDEQWLDSCDWVRLPDSLTPRRGLFLARVVGESMNRRIANGSWCLFTSDPGGSREGKVALVQSRSIQDPDHGGRYTIKVYHSEKIFGDADWQHSHIVLKPDSIDPKYLPIVLKPDQSVDLQVLGIFVASLGQSSSI